MENPFKDMLQDAHCACLRSDGLFVPVRQLSLVVALALLVVFLTFLGGYFLGKKHVVDEFVTKVEQDSFADQIYSSLCLLSDQDPDLLRAAASADVDTAEELASEPLVTVALPSVPEQEEIVVAPGTDIGVNPLSIPSCPPKQADVGKQYFAQLIGFGSDQAAQQFVNRMKKKNIPVELKVRESTSARGKKRAWYQVVTTRFEDREMLEKLVDRISKEEKIVGVQIVTC